MRFNPQTHLNDDYRPRHAVGVGNTDPRRCRYTSHQAQAWLLQQQEADGSFLPVTFKLGIHGGGPLAAG